MAVRDVNVKFRAPGYEQTQRKIDNIDKSVDETTEALKRLQEQLQKSAKGFDRLRKPIEGGNKATDFIIKAFIHFWDVLKKIILVMGVFITVIALGARGVHKLMLLLIAILNPVKHLAAGVGLSATLFGALAAVILFVGKALFILHHGLVVVGVSLINMRKALSKSTQESVKKHAPAIHRLGVKIKEYAQKIKTAGEKTKAFASKISSASGKAHGFAGKIIGAIKGIVLFAVAIIALIAAFVILIPLLIKIKKAAAAQEAVLNRLKNQIATTGLAYKDVGGHVNTFLDSMQKLTTYSRVQITSVLGHVTQMVGNLKLGMLGTRLAADMAASGFRDFESSGRALAQAMQGNVAMLARYIPELRISFGLIRANMSASEKWTVAHELLRKQFGGMATGELKTLSGAWKQFKNSVTNLLATVGKPLLEPLTKIVRLLTRMVNHLETTIRALQALHVLGKETPGMLDGIASIFDKVAERADNLGRFIGKLTLGFIELLTVINKTLGKEAMDRVKAFAEEFYGGGFGELPDPVENLEGVKRKLRELGIQLLSLTDKQAGLTQKLALYNEDLEKAVVGSVEWLQAQIKIKETQQELANIAKADFDARIARSEKLLEFKEREKELTFNLQMNATKFIVNERERKEIQINLLQTKQDSIDLDVIGLELLEAKTKWLEIELQIRKLIKDIKKGEEDDEKRSLNNLKNRVQLFAGPFASALASNIGRANQLSDALRGALNQLIAMVTQAAILAAIMAAISPEVTFLKSFTSLLGFAQGGKVPSGPVYAQGGFLARGTDEIPAMLSGGEKVLTARTVRENQTEIGEMEKGRGQRREGLTIINNFPQGIVGDERFFSELVKKSIEEAQYA